PSHMKEVWPSKRQSSVILILVCALTAPDTASRTARIASFSFTTSPVMTPTVHSRSCEQTFQRCARPRCTADTSAEAPRRSGVRAGAELVGERGVRMRRIAQETQRRARPVVERQEVVLGQLERQREDREHAIAQLAHRHLVGERLLLEPWQILRPLVVAEAA